MNRMELAAWVQVAVGAIGLAVAALGLTPTINAILRATTSNGTSMPFQGTEGAVQLFALVLVVATSLVFVSIGVAAILGRLFSLIHASAPFYAAFCVVVAMLLISVGATMGLLGVSYWIWPVLQACLLVILAGQSQIDVDKQGFFLLLFIGSVVCFVVGMATSGILHSGGTVT